MVYSENEEEEVFAKYGIHNNEISLFIVRPDGYIGFFTKNVISDQIIDYLSTLFIRK